MSDHDARHWDRRYHSMENGQTPEAAAVLRENRHLLPARGVAVDIAAGRGGNALLFAAAGLDTHAWDFSGVALRALEKSATDLGLRITTKTRDVVEAPPPPDSFDVIAVSNFLDRKLAPHLAAALREGGLLFYQTFTIERVSDAGPGNPAYRLEANELLHLFSGLRLVHYHEEGTLGDATRGFRDRAQFIGCKDSRAGRST